MSVHGYVAYKPKKYGAAILAGAKQVLTEYEAWESPLTVRQVFYRLVAEYGYDKTEGAYGSLVNYIARSRRAYQRRILDEIEDGASAEEARDAAINAEGLIPFSWIRDEKGQSIPTHHYEGADDFIETIQSAAKGMKLDRQSDQPRRVELWCEAAGMVPLLTEIGEPYGIRVSSGGGYDSVTAKHELARRVVRTWGQEGKETVVLHIGDFDPSGEGMFETLDEDVSEMVWDIANRGAVRFERIALREDQVIEMEIETAPPKPLDSRSRGFVAMHPEAVEHFGSEQITAQLEALKPPELTELVTAAITERINDAAYQAVLEREEEIREDLTERLNGAGS
jgi:hypothetical protein